MQIKLLISIVALLFLANAGAMTVSGNISLLSAPPVSNTSGNLTSTTNAFLWSEQSDLSLLSPIRIDVIPYRNNTTGLYKRNKNRVQSTWSEALAPGSYDSFMLHMDTTKRKTNLTGSITFDTDIVGIIFKRKALGTSDPIFGTPSTFYDGTDKSRGFGLKDKKNWFSISPDRRTFAFQSLVTRENINELRILSQGQSQIATVPLPASIWLFGSALCLLTWIRHRVNYPA